MANIALNADGLIFGLPCATKIEYINEKSMFSGRLDLNKESISKLLIALGAGEYNATAICNAMGPLDGYIEFRLDSSAATFAASSSGVAIVAVKSDASAFALLLETDKMANSQLALFNIVESAAKLLCIKSLYLKYGALQLDPHLLETVGVKLPSELPNTLLSSQMLLYGSFDFASGGAFGDGMRMLLGLDQMHFAAAKIGEEYLIGAYINELCYGDVHIKNLFCAIKNNGFSISGQLSINHFSFVLDCSASLSSFSLSGYMPHGSEIDLGSGWRITELALGIGYKSGIMISMLGRIYARKLMLFAALSLSFAPSAVTLNFLSAATSDLTLPNIVYSFTTAEISGLENFDFIRIEGFALDGAACLSPQELCNNDALATGFNRVMSPSGLELHGSYKITTFGSEKILTDEGRMRNYTVYPNGQIKLNPQFYFAPCDFGSFGGYDIKKGAFFCGVLTIFSFSVKLFFQTNDNGIMAYLNISPIKAGIFELTESSFKANAGVLKPSGGGMVSQFLSSATNGPELFVCMSNTQKCFYLDAHLRIWGMLNFDAHVVYADKLVSIDTKFTFLSIFDVSFCLKADYSSFNNLNFEFVLIADTSGLKRLVQGAINKIEGAARAFNSSMDNAVNSVNGARNSLNGLWGQISNFDSRISNCRNRINSAPWYKKWYIAIGAGFEIGAYEIAKAGIYIAIGVAQAALAIAEGILRLAQCIGGALLSSVQGFLQGIISIFYIERLAFAGLASSSGAALGVKMDFVALGKSYSTSGVLSMGGDADSKCQNLLNSMVEDNTADEVRSLNSAKRSYKKSYRLASIEGSQELFAQGSDYCRRTRAYMRDLQGAYAKEYGSSMAHSDEMLMNVDNAIASARQSAELILSVTDDMNFDTAFNEMEQKLSCEPTGRATNARSKSLSSLKTQWEQVSQLKKSIRLESQHISRQTDESVYRTSNAKTQSVLENVKKRSIDNVFNVDPDRILTRAEGLMYQKFKASKGHATFCPYCEPEILKAIDACRTKPLASENIKKNRSANRKADYKARL